MKQKLLKTLVLGVLALWGGQVWADGVNLLSKSTITMTKGSDALAYTQDSETKAITFAPGKNTSYKISLEVSGVTLDGSQIFVVVEATSEGLNTGEAKVRNITLNENLYDNASGTTTNGYFVSKAKMDSEGSVTHMLAFLNPIKADYKCGDTKIVEAFAENDELSLTKVEFNLKTPSNSIGEGNITIYSIGFYNLAEIIAKFPYIDKKWQFVNGDNLLRIENSGDANKVKIKGNNTLTLTYNEGKVLFKSLGNLPNTFNPVDLRSLAITDGKYEAGERMGNLTNITKVLLSTDAYKYYPTMNTNVYVLGNRYYAYKDGIAPATTHNGGDGNKDGTNGRYFSFTRNFIEGYSSCVLPFQLDVSILPTGLSVYTFGSCTAEGEITFNKATENINCNTPFIVKAEKEGVYMFSLFHGSEGWNEGKTSGTNQGWKYFATAASNDVKFVGSFVNEVPSGDYATTTNYGITSDGTRFAPMVAGTTKTTYYRAFLADGRSTDARELMPLFIDSETTGIANLHVNDNANDNNAPIYNLAGQRVDKNYKGVVIQNGKKFIQK